MEVRNVYNGAIAEVNPDRILSIDQLQEWVADKFGIKKEHQLLLTGNAVRVKMDGLVQGQCIYLYDKSLIFAANLPDDDAPEETQFEEIPTSGEIDSVVCAKPLFIARAKWAVSMLTKAEEFNTQIEQIQQQVGVIKSGIRVAVTNLHTHSTQLEKSYYHKEDFFNGFENNFAQTAGWNNCYQQLGQVRVNDATLADWIDKEEIERAFDECVNQRQQVKQIMEGLSSQVIQVINHGHSLENEVKEWANRKNSNVAYRDILQDVKAVVLRIERDSEHVTGLDESAASVGKCRRLAGLHYQEFLTQIKSSVEDMQQQLGYWQVSKKRAQDSCIDYLKQVSSIQVKTSQVRPELKKLGQALEVAEDSRVKVAKAVDLPFLYGMWIIEQIRRSRWVESMRNVVGETAESFSQWAGNELRLRKSWMRHYGATLYEVKGQHPGEETMPECEVNFRPGDLLTEQGNNDDGVDIETYLQRLFDADLMEPHDALRQEYDDMIKRDDQLRLAGDQSVSQQQQDKQQQDKQQQVHQQEKKDMETSIKGYVTRIKKLEDLLYREQYNRRNSGDWSTSGTPVSNMSYVANGIMPMTPPQHHQPTQAPTSPASNDKQYKQLQAKVKQMEDERVKDQEKIRQLEQVRQEMLVRVEKVHKERDTAEQVKKDLLDNFTNLESEFSRERRQLNQEISELRLRAEELEEEVEREENKTSEILNKHEQENTKLVNQVEQLQLREREMSKTHSQELDKLIEKEHHLESENDRLQAENDRYYDKSKDLSQRLLTGYKRSCELLECMGLQAQKQVDPVTNQVESFTVKRVRGISRRAKSGSSNSRTLSDTIEQSMDGGGGSGGGLSGGNGSSSNNNLDSTDNEEQEPNPTTVLYWMDTNNNEEEQFRQFMNEVYLDYDLFKDAVVKRFSDVEKLARKSQKYNDRARKAEQESRDKLSFKSFKEGELALFLPTRDQAKAPNNPWAAFNVNAPHYFLKSDSHNLSGREWVVARIDSMEERIVNRAVDNNDENPFDLSDGLKWYYITAIEE